ncbi:MAG: ATP-binding protein [Saccharofermentans sp.]|nr:ATP-binding protein [Saccharofermentans sp.]
MRPNKRTQQKVVKVYTCFNEGTVGILSEIEVSITPGIPTFEVIGLCDSVIRESRGRIQAALISSGYSMPRGHIVVSISPAYLHKSGSYFDLPIAIGMLMASGQMPDLIGKKIYAEGELSLTGLISGTPGAATRLITLDGVKADFDLIVLPESEATSVSITEIEGYLISHLGQLESVVTNEIKSYKSVRHLSEDTSDFDLDFSTVKGQPKAMRAITIAACGFHSILLLGSPGCGKTTIGNVIRGLLPPLDSKEMADVYMVKEAAGIGNDDGKPLALTSVRPLRRIYPGVSSTRILGSVKTNAPGELVLANHGVILADELCEFPIATLDSLRMPLEEHVVRRQKDGKDLIMQSEFIFVGLGNPCRCGMYYEKGNKCTCSPQVRRRYMNKISGPFGDRIDLYAEMRSISGEDMYQLTSDKKANQNEMYREMVSNAWRIQRERYQGTGIHFNGTVDKVDADLMRIPSNVQKHAAELSEKAGFSARGYIKLLKVGRTIADINGLADVSCGDVSEAAMYRYR